MSHVWRMFSESVSLFLACEIPFAQLAKSCRIREFCGSNSSERLLLNPCFSGVLFQQQTRINTLCFVRVIVLAVSCTQWNISILRIFFTHFLGFLAYSQITERNFFISWGEVWSLFSQISFHETTHSKRECLGIYVYNYCLLEHFD